MCSVDEKYMVDCLDCYEREMRRLASVEALLVQIESNDKIMVNGE